LKLAIIGCGGMARAHLRAYGQITEKEPEKFEFSAICNPVAESAKRFAMKMFSTAKSKSTRSPLTNIGVCKKPMYG